MHLSMFHFRYEIVVNPIMCRVHGKFSVHISLFFFHPFFTSFSETFRQFDHHKV